MKEIRTLLTWLCVPVAVLACGCAVDPSVDGEAEAVQAPPSEEPAATAVKLANQYYYRTDHFSEQCGASTLSVLTNGASNTWTPVPRGDVTYLKPYIKWNGAFDWQCGSPSVNPHDASECNGPTADWVRFYWDPNSRNIDVQCFKKCGDGSSPSDCAPY